MAIVALSARLLPLGGVSYLAWDKNAPPRGRSLGDPPEALSSCREYEPFLGLFEPFFPLVFALDLSRLE